ncbi:MAG: CRISPR-associated endonuclease Cas1 [Phycisphaeraceae bacterium]|nr:CRISPR-associated endonuclease Cas1 [Phycisphaeraceae bacterium]
MKKLLNTRFVTAQGAYLARKGDTVLVNVERETKLRVPIHNLGSIVCFGNVGKPKGGRMLSFQTPFDRVGQGPTLRARQEIMSTSTTTFSKVVTSPSHLLFHFPLTPYQERSDHL